METKGALVTGYPNYVARRLAERLVRDERTVFFLCRPEFEKEAKKKFAPYEGKIRVVAGDVISMDLGLSGPEIKELRSNVGLMFHLAGIYYLGSNETEMELVNIEGTRNALIFARELPGLKRFVHYSTAFVSGNRQGVVMEDELIPPPKFHNAFERTKFMAERIVREAMSELPITVVRPSIIVGDSRTGEIDRLDGPYFFMYVLVNLPINIQMPLPGKGVFPLNLVPVDYVVEAMSLLAELPAAEGRTFHLVDPNPLPGRKVFELVCEKANKKLPGRAIPSNLATALMKMPGLERPWRSPRLFMECFNQLVLFNSMNTATVLGEKGVVCPPFPSYVANLVNFLQKKRKGSS